MIGFNLHCSSISQVVSDTMKSASFILLQNTISPLCVSTIWEWFTLRFLRISAKFSFVARSEESIRFIFISYLFDILSGIEAERKEGRFGYGYGYGELKMRICGQRA